MSNIIQFTDRLLKATLGLSEMVNTCNGTENTPLSDFLTNLSSRISTKNNYCFEIVFLNNPTENLWNTLCTFIGIEDDFETINVAHVEDIDDDNSLVENYICLEGY